jgi:hypothetical protein
MEWLGCNNNKSVCLCVCLTSIFWNYMDHMHIIHNHLEWPFAQKQRWQPSPGKIFLTILPVPKRTQKRRHCQKVVKVMNFNPKCQPPIYLLPHFHFTCIPHAFPFRLLFQASLPHLTPTYTFENILRTL